MYGKMYSLTSVATSLGQPNILCIIQNHMMIDALGPSLAFWIISRAGQEVTPAEIQALIFMQGRSKVGSWLHPSALSTCR